MPHLPKLTVLSHLLLLPLLILLNGSKLYSQRINNPQNIRTIKIPGLITDTVHSNQPGTLQDENRMSDRSSYNTKKEIVLAGPITLTINATGTTCGYNNGTIIITASGGTAPYVYNIGDSWWQNTGYFPRQIAGSYAITVIDADGTIATANVNLTNVMEAPVIKLVGYTYATNCTSVDATVTLSATLRIMEEQIKYHLLSHQM